MKSAIFLFVCCLVSSSSARRKPLRSAAAADAMSAELRLTDSDPCYRDDGSATRCIPGFINAAYERQIVASSTCGNPPVNFCSQHPSVAFQQQQRRHNNMSKNRDDDDNDDERRNCVICDARHPHPASYLTDLNNPHNMTSLSAYHHHDHHDHLLHPQQQL